MKQRCVDRARSFLAEQIMRLCFAGLRVESRVLDLTERVVAIMRSRQRR